MKALVSILLSILFTAGSLFPGTDVEEVYKVPILLKHYQEHRAEAAQEGQDFSFNFTASPYSAPIASWYNERYCFFPVTSFLQPPQL